MHAKKVSNLNGIVLLFEVSKKRLVFSYISKGVGINCMFKHFLMRNNMYNRTISKKYVFCVDLNLTTDGISYIFCLIIYWLCLFLLDKIYQARAIN